jgi:hypothetical protein
MEVDQHTLTLCLYLCVSLSPRIFLYPSPYPPLPLHRPLPLTPPPPFFPSLFTSVGVRDG